QAASTTTTAPMTSTTTGCPGCCGETVATGLNNPAFVTIDSSGNLLVSDAGPGHITKFTSGSSNSVVFKLINATGNATVVAGEFGIPGGPPSQFNYPYGVYADS
ncbi:unnamed protein product, partial [Didymodactylos carnosus]